MISRTMKSQKEQRRPTKSSEKQQKATKSNKKQQRTSELEKPKRARKNKTSNERHKKSKLNQVLAINNFKEKNDSVGVVEQDVTLNEFVVLQLHVMKLNHELMKSTFI